jgi:thiamine-phosphate pyrophosphorylase
MRHGLEDIDFPFKGQLLQARHADTDVGADIKVEQQLEKRELETAVIANCKRVQQSLRVIEELAKIPEIKLDSNKFEKARFDLYTIERNIISGLLRKDKTGRIKGLYIIIDTDSLKGRSHTEMATQVLDGGARIVQLRDKTTPKNELLSIAVDLKKLCNRYDALFIVNDYVDIAISSDADGLHIGQGDIPVSVARKLLPIDKIIGCSVCTPEEAICAQNQGADYIAVGAIFPTISKTDIDSVGLEMLKLIKEKTVLPVVALGGIGYDNISEVFTAGADSVAVISAVLGAASAEETTRQIIKKLSLNNE